METASSSRKAAIDADELAERGIGEITARDFLNVLDREGLGARSLKLLPEMKKVALYAEPEWVPEIKVQDLVRALKVEKKKLELEIPPWFDRGDVWGPAKQGPGTSVGSSVGYPNPDGDQPSLPWHLEIRKTNLDSRFDAVANQLNQRVAQLQIAVQELAAKLERSAGR
jgi:hypothetical protein